MTTPICDFVRKYAEQNPVRFHMPGHKGVGLLGCEKYDVTEIGGADVLYHADGIIKESEDNAASLFGSGKTLYSTEGSSLSIKAMLSLALTWAKKEGRSRVVLAGRNAHKAFLYAAALLDFEITWLYPGDGNSSGVFSCPITAGDAEREIDAMSTPPCALYVTSPDYLGNTLELRSLSELCRRRGMLLLVDNAHGAYLRFLGKPAHPMELGADMCCDSAHKTLPVLTGGGYLHISKNAPELLREHAGSAMSLFASTSPSYLILQSLDYFNSVASREAFSSAAEKAEKVKEYLLSLGYVLAGDEPMKVTIMTKKYGYYGFEIGEYLRKSGIECELSDRDCCVLMLSPWSADSDYSRLCSSLASLPKRDEIDEVPPKIPRTKAVMTVREAMLSPSVSLPVTECAGRVLSSPSVSCPPAIPICASGEEIPPAECFIYYGIKRVRVVE